MNLTITYILADALHGIPILLYIDCASVRITNRALQCSVIKQHYKQLHSEYLKLETILHNNILHYTTQHNTTLHSTPAIFYHIIIYHTRYTVIWHCLETFHITFTGVILPWVWTWVSSRLGASHAASGSNTGRACMQTGGDCERNVYHFWWCPRSLGVTDYIFFPSLTCASLVHQSFIFL